MFRKECGFEMIFPTYRWWSGLITFVLIYISLRFYSFSEQVWIIFNTSDICKTVLSELFGEKNLFTNK